MQAHNNADPFVRVLCAVCGETQTWTAERPAPGGGLSASANKIINHSAYTTPMTNQPQPEANSGTSNEHTTLSRRGKITWSVIGILLLIGLLTSDGISGKLAFLGGMAIVALLIAIIRPKTFTPLLKHSFGRKKLAASFFTAAFLLTLGSSVTKIQNSDYSGGKTIDMGASAKLTTAEERAPKPLRDIGKEGYLRLPGINDSSQIICLAPTKEVYGEVSKTLQARDVTGILELTDKGVFCIGNGSKVLVIDSGFSVTQVRILAGVNDVDGDKVGRSGWTAYEWVVEK